MSELSDNSEFSELFEFSEYSENSDIIFLIAGSATEVSSRIGKFFQSWKNLSFLPGSTRASRYSHKYHKLEVVRFYQICHMFP